MNLSPSKIRTILTFVFICCYFSDFAQTTITDSIISGGIYRSYRIYIPAAYNGSSPRPLVFDLHGYTSNATSEQLYSNFMPIADTANFLTVYPQGTLLSGQPYWNAGLSSAGVNDVLFISQLIDSLRLQYNIDPDCVYSCGMSNGGYMSHTLACALNNRIAAIASVTGSMFTTQYATCVPNRAVPVMQISGTGDNTVPYNGNTVSLPIDTLVKYWVANDGCNTVPIFTNVPDVNTADRCTAEHYEYQNGQNNSSVELYKIINGGHTWPGSPYIIGVTNQDFSASQKIWLFFRKYKLSQFTGINELSSEESTGMFPNPCYGILNFYGENKLSIKIIDLNGQTVIETNQNQLDITSLAKGIYSVVLISDNKWIIKKLVKI